MAKYKPPSTPCRILRAIALLVQLKNKIRDKLWVSRLFTVPDDQKETETASTSNQQGFYDALTEPEVLISEADFAEPLIDFRLISEDGSSDGADCDMQDDDQSSLRRGWSAPVEMIDTGGSSDPRESGIQRGWSAPVEMMDTGGSSDPRRSSISAADWQKIMWLRQFLGLDVEVLPGPEWTVVLRVVSAFKRMPWLMRSRRQVRAVVVAQNRAAAAPPMKRIKSLEVTKYKGIRRRNKKWVCEIRIAGTKEKVWLGSYNTDKEAALALDAGRHHCTLKKSGYNFASSPRLLGEPQRFEHLTCEEKKEKIRKLAEKHAHEYALIDIQ